MGLLLAKVENVEFLTDIWRNVEVSLSITQEEVEEINQFAMQEINENWKEKLEEGSELVVSGVKKINYGNKDRYILQLENLKLLYISNYWLEKEIENFTMDLNYKIRIKIDKIKTIHNKNKERVIFCV